MELFEPILGALRRGGNVLVPVDTAGRVVELGLLFDEAWTQRKVTNYPIAILHYVAFNTFDFARSMIEWMSDNVSNKFDLNRENPFHFKNVHLCHSRAEVDALPSPKVVLASSPSLETGFSQELFLDWASNEDNMIMLVDRVETGTLAWELSRIETPTTFKRLVKKRVPLEGAELREWREADRQKDIEMGKVPDGVSAMEIGDTGEANAAIDSELSQDEEEDPNETLKHQGVKLFPFHEKQRRWDDYGEVVDVAQFMVGEDPGDAAGEGMAADGAEDEDAGAEDVIIKMEGVTDAEEEKEKEKPSKYISKTLEVVVNCEIVRRDFSGLSDGRSLKELIVSVAPRRLIVVHGTEAETAAVRDIGIKSLGLREDLVVCPNALETVDVTSDTSIYRVRLDDSIFKTLRWRRIPDGDIAYVSGKIRLEDTGDREDVVLEAADASASASGHATVFVGDMRLLELKERLRRSNPDLHPAFANGILYTEDPESKTVVTIKKRGPGDFALTAPLSEEYFQIRDQFYTHFVAL